MPPGPSGPKMEMAEEGPEVCSYCGCEAEAVIAELMADHEEIAELAVRVVAALDAGDAATAGDLTGRVGRLFDRHARKEETGLFAQLAQAGEAGAAVARFESQHADLRAGLTGADPTGGGAALRAVLDELCRHADAEDTDLFPAAVQLLPNERWSAVAGAHAAVAAGAGPVR